MKKTTVPRIALIGISGYGRVYLKHLEAAQARNIINFSAAVVINPEAEPEACARLQSSGVEIYDSWQSMLKDQQGRLDLCLIPLPIHLHERVTVAALESGSNVLLEKPLAASVLQGKSIQDAEHRTGRWVAVGYQDFYSQSTDKITEGLTGGRIGQIESIDFLGLWPRNEDYYRRNAWAGRLSVGGMPVRDSPLNNAMAHFLHLALLWAGRTPGVVAWPDRVHGDLFRSFQITSFDTAVVEIGTSTGVKIRAAVTHRCEQERPIHFRVRGSEGEMHWTHKQNWEWRNGKATERYPLESDAACFSHMFQTVLRRIESPATRICTTAHALPHVACIEALHAGSQIHQADDYEFADGMLSDGPGSAPNFEKILTTCLHLKGLPSELGLCVRRPGSPEAVKGNA